MQDYIKRGHLLLIVNYFISHLLLQHDFGDLLLGFG